jgi:hypothetical protein
LDLRNHGESPWTPSMSYRHMAADVVRAVEAHVEGPVHLVGHSMGGVSTQPMPLCLSFSLFETDPNSALPCCQGSAP